MFAGVLAQLHKHPKIVELRHKPKARSQGAWAVAGMSPVGPSFNLWGPNRNAATFFRSPAAKLPHEN